MDYNHIFNFVKEVIKQSDDILVSEPHLRNTETIKLPSVVKQSDEVLLLFCYFL